MTAHFVLLIANVVMFINLIYVVNRNRKSEKELQEQVILLLSLLEIRKGE